MNSNEESLIVEVIGQLVSKIIDLKAENKRLKEIIEKSSTTNVSEKKVHKSAHPEQDQQSKRYIFGKATMQTVAEFKEFVEHCINGEGRFEMNPEKVAVWMGISSRARDTYLNSLKSHKIGDKPIIVDINGQWYSNFSKEIILENFFKVVE